jgi:hypothetical protein
LVPALQRSSSKREHKSRLLKNLQALHISNSNTSLVGNATADGSTMNELTPSSMAASSTPHDATTASAVIRALPELPSSAVNNIYVHYLRNPPEANLPQFCTTTEDLDLGHLKARVHLRNKKFTSALRTLLPTLIAVEVCVTGSARALTGGSSGERQTYNRAALLELGELYYLRGKIQLEAARTTSVVSFPFQVGSSGLFDRVTALLPVCATAAIPVMRKASEGCKTPIPLTAPASGSGTEPAAQTVGRRFAQGGASARVRGKTAATGAAAAAAAKVKADPKPAAQTLAITTRETRTYTSAADLCWDAMKWFQRAKEVARLAGDEIGAARAANSLAQCHLLPTFVPHALFKIPLDRAADLSTTAPAPLDSKGRQRPRKASLREVQICMKGALDVHQHSCLPLPLIDAYLNLAEMCELLGNPTDGVAFWREAKDLFQYLFADGVLVPLVRRASASFVCKARNLIDRMVQYMYVLDATTVNSNLQLLDMQIIFGHEVERLQGRNAARSQAVAAWLPDVLTRLIVGDTTVPAAPSGGNNAASQRAAQKSKRKTISRVSRFFSRLFRSDSNPELPQTASQEPSTVSSVSFAERTEGPTHRRVSNGSPPKSSMRSDISSVQRSSATGGSGKATNSFDSFIERSGFNAQLDMRRFYNIMNAGLVAEKVHDFGWSRLVEHEALLKSIVKVPAPAVRSQSDSSASTVPPGFVQNAATDLSSLVSLNLRAKLDFAIKFRRLAMAQFLHEHVLRRAQLTVDDDLDGGDGWMAGDAYGELDLAPGSEAAAVAALFRSSLRLKAPLTPRSDSTPRSNSFSGLALGNLSPHKAALLNLAARGGSPSRAAAVDLPIDPYADFDWMDESFADYTPHGRSLQIRAMIERMQGSSAREGSGSRNKYRRVALGVDTAQFSALFMPEFDEAHHFTAEEVQHASSEHLQHHRNATGSSLTDNWINADNADRPSCVAGIDAEYLRGLDSRAETVLVQRAWRCYLLLQNAQRGYRSAEGSVGSLGHVRHEARSALCSLSLNMVRLRAFSRQYQTSMLDFERLQTDLPVLPVSIDAAGNVAHSDSALSLIQSEAEVLRNGTASVEQIRAVRRTAREHRSRQAVLLHQRLPYVVYTIHVRIVCNNLIFCILPLLTIFTLDSYCRWRTI